MPVRSWSNGAQRWDLTQAGVNELETIMRDLVDVLAEAGVGSAYRERNLGGLLAAWEPGAGDVVSDVQGLVPVRSMDFDLGENQRAFVATLDADLTRHQVVNDGRRVHRLRGGPGGGEVLEFDGRIFASLSLTVWDVTGDGRRQHLRTEPRSAYLPATLEIPATLTTLTGDATGDAGDAAGDAAGVTSHLADVEVLRGQIRETLEEVGFTEADLDQPGVWEQLRALESHGALRDLQRDGQLATTLRGLGDEDVVLDLALEHPGPLREPGVPGPSLPTHRSASPRCAEPEPTGGHPTGLSASASCSSPRRCSAASTAPRRRAEPTPPARSRRWCPWRRTSAYWPPKPS